MKTEHKTILALAATVAVLSASAETIVWTGAAGDYSWHTSGNWDPAQVPGAADDVWLGTSSYADGVYAQPITLGSGGASCNSLNFYQNATITVGAAGEKLTVSSGSVTMNNTDVDADKLYLIACDIDLQNPDGANVWTVIRGSDPGVDRMSDCLKVSGAVTANSGSGTIKFHSSNRYRRGKVVFDGTVSCAQPVEFSGAMIDIGSRTFDDIFGIGARVKFSGFGGVVIVRNMAQPFTTPIDMTSVGRGSTTADDGTGVVSFVPYGTAAVFKTDVVVPAGTELCLGSTGATLIDLQSKISGDGCLAVMRTGVLVHSADDLPSSARMYGSGGGFIIDRTSMTSESFFAHFPNGGLYTKDTTGKWGCLYRNGGPGGGFGAYGAPFVIPAAEGSETWFGSQVQLQLGLLANADANVQRYLTHPVILENGIALTKQLSIQSTHAVAVPTFKSDHDISLLNRIDGDITGAGALKLAGQGLSDELVIGGESKWTGSFGQVDFFGWNPDAGAAANSSVNTGPGGMMLTGAPDGFVAVTFACPKALPHGNNGATAYLAAGSRYTARTGYFFSASGTGNKFALADGMKVLLCQGAGNGPTIPFVGSTGRLGEWASLSGDIVLNRHKPETDAYFSIIPRGAAEFRLGDELNPCRFVKAIGYDLSNANGGIGAAATPLADDTGRVWVYLRGEGTVVPVNVDYTTLDHSGDATSRFIWCVGADANLDPNDHPLATGGYNSTAIPKTRSYVTYRGAVRAKGTDPRTSILGFPIIGLGGTIELEDTDINLTTTADLPTAGYVRMRGGLGFAAYGTRDVTVKINGDDEFKIGDGTNGVSPEGYPHANAGMIFGSLTANRTVLFHNDVNLYRNPTVYLVGGTEADRPVVRFDGKLYNGQVTFSGMKREDGTDLASGMAEIANGDTILASLQVKGGIVLVSANISSTTGNSASFVANGGELRVTGSLPSMGGHVQAGKNGDATVGGVLSGTGVIDSHVIIWGGAELHPGVNGTGSLTLKRNLQFYNDSKLVLGVAQPTVHAGGNMYIANRATVVLDGDIEGKRAILSWDGSLGYVDGGSAETSDCSQWTVAGVAKPQNYSFKVDTANKCIWLKNNKPGLILIVR